MKPALSVEDLSVQFGDRSALKDITFTLPQGSFLAIVGPNGSGKSTLIKTILRLIKPTTGRIEMNDVRSVGYVPQIKTHDRTFPARAIDVVSTGILKRWPWRTSASTREEALAALRRTNAEHLAFQSPARMSGGQIQRVYLARALAQKPNLFVFDEPASGIDVAGDQSIHETIETIQQDNNQVTVVMVTHDLSVAFHHATHVLVLSTRQVAYGKATETLTDEVMRQAFGHVGHSHAMNWAEESSC